MLRLEQRGLGFHSKRCEGGPIEFSLEDRLRSVYVVGKTGTGKSTLLLSMILQDISAGHGVCVIDPHGDLYRAVLGRVPEERFDDVVLIDPSDTDFPIGLNPLEIRSESERHFVIQEFVGALERLIADEFGPEALPHITGPVFFQHVRMGLLLATSNPATPGTLLDFYNIFQKREYWRRWLPLKSADPLLQRWTEEVLPKTNYLSPGSDNASLGGYVGSKFQNFVFDPRLRNIFAQRRSTINLRQAIAERRILLVNLAKGRLTETNSRFFGMMLLGLLQNAVLSRVDYEPTYRTPFFLYVDEFQSVATRNFVSLISEGRKFSLGLVLANQFVSQIDNARITYSILGNVGTLVAFRLGPADAELIGQEMLPTVTPISLVNLPNRRAFVKALVNGEPARPALIQTVLPAGPYCESVAEHLTNVSRRKYGRRRNDVEEEIAVSSDDNRAEVDTE